MDRAARRRADRAAGQRSRIALPAPTPAEPGRVNIWACPVCGLPTVARDLHQGTTPMVLGCRARASHFTDAGVLDSRSEGVATGSACTGMARSVFYQLPPEASAPWWLVELLADPPWEWYAPTDPDELETLRRSEAHVFDHVRRGGLLLRKGPNPRDAGPEPTTAAAKPSAWRRFWGGL